MLGLGGSVGTAPNGLEADVLVVANFEELAKRAADAKGTIVLFNVPYTNYGETVTYRSTGARTAAQYGAVAALVRAVGPTGLRTLLASRDKALASTIVSKMTTYALGRGVEHYDLPAIRAIVRDAEPGGYRWSSLVLGIVRSVPFQMRRAE